MNKFMTLMVAVTAVALTSSTAAAASKYFAYGPTTNIWDTTSLFWGDASGGPYASLWVADDGAIFEGASGTIALAGDQAANSLTFTTGGYTISNATLALSAPAAVTNNVTATIKSSLAGSAGLTKIGAGTLILSGSAANTYTGTTTINGTGSYAAPCPVGLSKTAGVSAIPGDVTMVNNEGNVLYTTTDNQLTGSSIVTLSGGSGNSRFELIGTTQTMAGVVNDGTGRGVIQNQELGPANPAGVSRLVLSGSGDYSFGGYLRGYNGTLGLTLNGNGTQTLAGANITYNGPTIINSGVLNLVGGDSGGFGSAITLNGGTLIHSGAGWRTIGGLLNVAVDSTIRVNNTGANRNLFFDAGITGSGNLIINSTGDANTGIHFRNGTPGLFSGNLTVNNGQIASQGNGFNFQNSNVTLNNANWYMDGSQFATTAANEQIGSLNGNGNVVMGGYSLTLGTNNKSGSYGGALSGSGPLIKTGSGTQVLTGANVNTGATTINGGKLVVDGSLAAGSAVTVNSGALLGGTGTVAGAVVAAVGGGVSPGDGGLGTLTVGALTLNTNSVSVIDVDGTPTNDVIVVANAGGLTNNGGAFLLYSNGTANTWIPALGSTYKLIQYSGGVAGSGGFAIANSVPGLSYTFTSDGTWVSVTVGGPSLWTGGGSDDLWTSGANWGGVAPSSGAALVFDGGSRTSNTNDFAAGTSFSLLFTNTAGAFTLSGNTITLAGSVVNRSVNPQVINSALILPAAQVLDTSAGAMTFNGGLSGKGGIIKTGTGTVTLNSAGDTYTGGTTVNAGKLVLNATAAIANNTPLTINSGAVVSLTQGNNAINGLTSITINGGTLSADGGASQAHTLLAGNGVITLNGGVMAGNGNLNGTYGQFWLGNGGNPMVIATGDVQSVISGQIHWGNWNTFNIYDGASAVDLLVSGQIGNLEGSAWGYLNKTGPGTMAISNSGNAIGQITVSAGKLIFQDSMSGMGNGGLINNSVVEANIGDGLNRAFALTVSGSGSFTKSGGGTLQFNGGGQIVAQSQFYLTQGQLQNNNNSVNWSGNTGNMDISNGATLDLYADPVYVNQLTGSGTVRNSFGNSSTYSGSSAYTERLVVGVANGSSTFSGLITDTGLASAGANQGLLELWKNGTGTLTLPGANTYGGGTMINAGTLRVNNAAGSATGNGLMTIGSGAMLTGTGTVSNVAVSSGGAVAPGNGGVGILNSGSLTLAAGSSLIIEFNGATNDQVVVVNSGGTIINGGAITLVGEGSSNPWATNGTYNLIHTTGAIGGAGTSSLSVANAVGGKNYVFGVSGGWVTLTISDATGWTGGSSVDSNWTSADNWGGVTPPPGAALAFGAPGAARVSNNNNFPDNTPFFGITFANSAYTLGGNTVRLTGNIFNTTNLTQTLNLALVLDSASRTFDTGDGTITANGAIGEANGSWGLSKAGVGVLILNAANLYTGPTTINAGTLKLGTGGVIPDSSVIDVAGGATVDVNGQTETIGALSGSGAVALGAGTLTVNDSTNTTFGGSMSGTGGSLVKAGSSTQTLSGANTYDGGSTLSAGTLALGSGGALGTSGTINFAGGILQHSAANTADYSSRFSPAAGQLYNIDTASQNVTLASALTSSGGTLTKIGAGQLTLSGANTYDGGTTINAGTVQLGAGGGSGTAGGGPVSIGSGTTLAINRSDSFSFSNTLSGVGAIYKAGGNTVSYDGTSTFSGAVQLAAGVFTVNGTMTGVGTAQQATGDSTATWTVNGTLSANNLNLANGGGGNGGYTAGTLNVNSGGAATIGTMQLAFIGWSYYTTSIGTINVGGVLNVTNILGYNYSYGEGYPNYYRYINVNTNGRLNAVNVDFSQTSANAQMLTISGGTLANLPGTNLTVDATTPVALTGSGTMEVETGRFIRINNTVQGSGSLIKAGAGTLTLNGSNTFTGASTVNAGTLLLNNAQLAGSGTITLNNGVFKPGALSNAVSRSSLTVLNGGTLDASSASYLAGQMGVGAGGGTILLGPGLEFVDSSTNTWAGGTVSLVGALGSTTLRFGTTRNGLTLDQKGRMIWNGRRVTLDDQGYVVLASGFIILVE